MHLIYIQHSGKPVDKTSGNFWVQAGVSLPAEKWKALQLRLNGLIRSFQKTNYDPMESIVDANDLLHPRNAEKKWTRAFCKGFEKIVAGLEPSFFLVVVDKRTTDRPAHPKWLLPLTYNYLMKPICQHLRDANDCGCIVIPPGRPDEAEVLAAVQNENLFGPSGRTSPLVSSPMIQSVRDACGLQVADFLATVTRRYHETVYPKLFAKETLVGYDAVLNSHYQGFVKPNTYQSSAIDAKGYKIRGYIYLWRRDNLGRLRLEQPSRDEISLADVARSTSSDIVDTRALDQP